MPELNETAKATDAAEITVDTDPTTPTRKTYKVLAEAGLFKNGNNVPKDSTIELDQRTADGFLALNDIEEVK